MKIRVAMLNVLTGLAIVILAFVLSYLGFQAGEIVYRKFLIPIGIRRAEFVQIESLEKRVLELEKRKCNCPYGTSHRRHAKRRTV